MIFVVCIFLGGATEITISEWVSNFIESGIGLPKVMGDILGVAMFAVMLGIGRTAYAKIGRNISMVMLWGMAGATVCYLVASLSLNSGVALAAGGDLGASVGPQLVGIVSDKIAVSGAAANIAQRLNITAEQVGIRAGMLIAAIFPLLGVITILRMRRHFKDELRKEV